MVSRQPAAKKTTTPRKRAQTPTMSAHEAQAAAEGVDIIDKVTLKGASFRLSDDEIGIVPLIMLARAGKRGADSNDMDGLVAIYDVLHDCIHEDDFDAFMRHATATKASGDELMEVMGKAIAVVAARPTRPPGGSSAGRATTSASLKGSSSGTVMPPEGGYISVDSLLGR